MRIVGQPPKVRCANGCFIRLAVDGETVGQAAFVDQFYGCVGPDRYVTVESDDRTIHEFRAPGSVVRIISVGDPYRFSITEIDIPTTLDALSQGET